MKGIEPRFYRNQMGEGRFSSFVVGYKDSDLWIGVDPQSYKPEMPLFAQTKLVEFRKKLENYLLIHPKFATSFTPIAPKPLAPDIAVQMALAGHAAGTGPMAAVAGAFSEYLGKALCKTFDIKEIVVENGGDIYLSLQKSLILSIYAGTSPLSGKIGVEIPANKTPLGVCTSAGTVGPSTSFGNADAVMVVSKNTAIADAYATAIGNHVKSDGDVNTQIEAFGEKKELYALIIICQGKIGIKGQFAIVPIANSNQ